MKRILSLLVLAALLMLAGCYNYTEPDEKALVMAIGLDKGKQNRLTVTMVIAVPKNIAGGGGGQPASGGGGQGNFFTVSMEVETVLGSLELLNAMVDRQADLSHTKWFVFSRELAEEGIGRYYAPLTRFYQFRRTTHMVICEGRAEEFLTKGVPKLEDNVGKFYELMQRGWRYTEYIPFNTFNDFYNKTKSPGVRPVAILAALAPKNPVYSDNAPKPDGEYRAGRIPRKGGNEIELMGGAVFKEGKMVGILNAAQTGIQKMFFGHLANTIVDLPDPRHSEKYIIVRLRPRQNPEINVQIVDGYPKIDARVFLEGDIISIQSGERYEQPERVDELENAVEEGMGEIIAGTIEKSRELGDFLGFGLHAKKEFSTWPQWVAYNWDEKYPAADIVVSVDFRVRRVGLVEETRPFK